MEARNMSLTLGIDDDLKKKTKDNFKKMGMDMTTATRMFYLYVDQHGKLPFTPSVGRTELEQAVHESKTHQYADEFDSLEDFRKNIYSDED